jgi:aromatic-L-amino-acid decarboxylase
MVQETVVMDLQERGVAAPSLTILDGRAVIRAAIVNHRTTTRHADHFVDCLLTSVNCSLIAGLSRQADGSGAPRV